MGSSGGGSSSSSSSKPWKEQRPYLEGIYSQAQNLYNQGSIIGPGQQEAYQATIDRARAGSPLLEGAQNLNQYTVGGGFLNSNPYLDQTFDQAASRVSSAYNRTVLPNIETRFGGSGRRNSGAYNSALGASAQGLGDQLSRLATNIYGQNYARERGIQQNAAQMAPTLAREDYADIGRLGNAYQALEMEPWQRLAQFTGAIGAPVMTSSQQSSTTPGWISHLPGGLL